MLRLRNRRRRVSFGSFKEKESHMLVIRDLSKRYGSGPLAVDGLNLTVMTDYIPFTYADVIDNNGKSVTVPYKMKGLNVALGLTIVAGTNPSKPKKQPLAVPERETNVHTNTDL